MTTTSNPATRLRRWRAMGVLTGVRAGLGVLERVSPELGGRWGEFLFFRVPRTPPASRRAGRGRPGDPFELDLDGRTIRGEVWGEADAPAVHLLHGWGGWRQQLESFVEPLVAAGCRVVAFDALAHGSSDPGRFERRTSRIYEISDCLIRVIGEFGQPLGVVAHSGGAMAAILAVHEGRVTPGRLVLVAPSVRVPDMLEGMSRTIGLGRRSGEVMVRRAVARIQRPASDFDTPTLAADMAARGVLPPALIAHDRGDLEAPASGSELLHAAWPGSRLLLTEDLGHSRILRNRHVVEAAVEFLTDAGASATHGSG